MARDVFNRNPHSNTYMHAHGDGQIAIEKTFDAEPAIDHARYMRNEVVQRGELRKAMSVPTPLLNQWIREGKLGEVAFVGNKPVVDMQTLQKLMKEYSAFACMDKI